MNYDTLPEFYSQLDAKFNITNGNLENATYTNVDSNFVFSSDYPRHRWFNYKEGFSPVLVERIFNEAKITNSSMVCDPFCGAGTTLMVAKSNQVKSIGFEVNPFAAFITKVKTADYLTTDIAQLQKWMEQLKGIDFQEQRTSIDNEYICRIFDPEMFKIQLNIRHFIFGLPECGAKDLIKFAWLCTLEECSLYRKAGNGLKKKTRAPEYSVQGPAEYALTKIKNRIKSIIDDFSVKDNGPIPTISQKSATNLNLVVKDNSLDLVLFSPPYANCFDYTKIYIVELWMGGFIESTDGQKAIRMDSIRSHCHATWPDRFESFHLQPLHDEILPLLKEQKLWTNRIPDMLNGYFADMEEVLKKIYVALKPGGHCDIVVSNSAYAGIIIPTDVFLAMIAERIGFKTTEIEVERLIITSSQQYKRTEHIKRYLRESIVKLEKKG